VLSATGCGLLITGLRKLRAIKGAGLSEAAAGGLLMAFFQFIAALSFPGVIQGLEADPISRPGFYTTWGLVAIFTTLFAVIGAVLGHLIFGPLRTQPNRAARKPVRLAVQASTSDEDESAGKQVEDAQELADPEDDGVFEEEMTGEVSEPEAAEVESVQEPAGSGLSYVISILLLGLAPFVTGYVFAAAFDFSLNLNQYDPGPFPTLRLLSGLLPWQIPLSINLPAFNLTLAWRIPLAFGNPSAFDVQAIEPFALNAAGLACALLSTFVLEQRAPLGVARLPLRALLLLEALLGLILVLPANLWIAFGLHGLLQIQTIAVLLRTLQLLNPLTFTLNLITAPLLCVIIGMAIARLRRNTQ
jgi:hypothetical protein